MPKKNKSMTHSKILKCIVACLENVKFPHVLRWRNRAEREFIIVFVHKSNPAWNISFLDLFKELDGLSKKKLELYLQKSNYESACKVRCKSNLKKLCTEGALSFCWKNKENKSKFVMCYKINDTSGICLSPSEEHETEQKQKAFEITMSNRNASIQGTIEDNELSITSHFPCLSNQTMSNRGETIQGYTDNVGLVPSYANPYVSKEDLISHEYSAGLGSTNMMIDKKIIKNQINMGKDTFEDNWISHECTGGLGSANMLKNKKYIKNCVTMESDRIDDVTISHECTGGFGSTNMLTNKKSIRNGFNMRNVTFYGDMISHECTGGLGSTNMMTNKKSIKNGYIPFDEKLMFHHEDDGVSSEDYGEFAEVSLYQNMQGTLDLFATNKVSAIDREDVNLDRNAILPDRLCSGEDSFDFYNLIDQDVKLVGTEEFHDFCLDAANNMKENSLDPFLDCVFGGSQMDEDPFVCCGSRGLCSCKAI